MKPSPLPVLHKLRIPTPPTHFRQTSIIYLNHRTAGIIPFRFALVDNDAILRQTVLKAMTRSGSRWLIESYSDYRSFLRSITSSAIKKDPRVKKMDSWSAVLLAASIAGVSCLQCLGYLKTLLPDVPVILLGDSADPMEMLEFVVAGASGFLLKPVPLRTLVQALKRVAKGWPAFCRRAESSLLEALRPPDTSASANLTLRQKEILALLVRGLSYKEIGSVLGIAIGSVHTHVAMLYKKLGAHGRKDAINRFLHQFSSGDEPLCG